MKILLDWIENNKRHNPNKDLVFNITGHMAVIIMQSIPYVIGEACNILHEIEMETVLNYLKNTFCTNDSQISDLEPDIHWAPVVDNNRNIGVFGDIGMCGDEQDFDNLSDGTQDSSSVIFESYINHQHGNNNDANNDTGSVQEHNNNNDNNDIDIDIPWQGRNQSLLGDYSSHSSDNRYVFDNVHQNSGNNNNGKLNDSDTSSSSGNIFRGYEDDNSSENLYDEEKDDLLPDDIVGNRMSDSVKEQAAKINSFNLPKVQESFVEEKNSDEINYHYKYKFRGDLEWRKFDNNKNVANVLYSRYFNLCVIWDYASLWRKLISVFCTMQWPKNAKNVTPREIKRAQIWGRTALYKAIEYGRYLLHDYAFLCGGVGTYMLEAFWHYNPHGHGFYVVNQQMCEHWGNWMKHNRLDVGGTTEERYLWELADNYDIYVMGRILVDMVDFSKVVKNETLRSQEVFNLEENDIVEKNALTLTPVYFQMLAQRMSQILVNDEFPPFMTELHDQEQHVYIRITEALKKQTEAQDKYDRKNQENINVVNEAQNVREWRERLKNASKIRKKVQKNQQSYQI